MAGRWETIGGRRTYLPPFVNERFEGPPWWACTFTALLNGANVGWLGAKDATHREVLALANASGDPDIRGGSRSSHMVAAVRARYRTDVRIQALPPKAVQGRLASGWALVAAVSYGQLPAKHRKLSPRFTGGHRVTLVGWQGTSSRLLDPLEPQGPDFGGRWIAWSDLEPAWWSREQLWFREGQYAPGVLRVAETFGPRTWRIAAGATVEAWSATEPNTVVRRVRFELGSSASYDALVDLVPAATGGQAPVRYLRVSNGMFAGRLVKASNPGITADGLQPPPATSGSPALATGAAPAADAAGAGDSLIEARRAEWDRIDTWFAGKVNMPPRP